MAYSNINKDKVQADRSKGWKRPILAVVFGVILITSLSNIYHQAKLIGIAKERNSQLLGDITKIDNDNKKLEAEIKYAQSEEGKNRNLREYLGVGSSGDYWLKTDKSLDNFDLYQTPSQKAATSNWEKWWQLFTN